jgi:hypothetical protein
MMLFELRTFTNSQTKKGNKIRRMQTIRGLLLLVASLGGDETTPNNTSEHSIIKQLSFHSLWLTTKDVFSFSIGFEPGAYY